LPFPPQRSPTPSHSQSDSPPEIDVNEIIIRPAASYPLTPGSSGSLGGRVRIV